MTTEKLCKKHEIENYTIRPDGLVDVNGDVYLSEQNFKQFPIKFGTVSGYFNCSNCASLTSLQGAPQTVGGDFDCYGCDSLINLQGAPQQVDGSFYCWNCASLINLQGAPNKVGRDFNCWNCASLTNLQGAPKKVGGDFDCRNTSINIKGLVLINAKTFNNDEVKIPKDKYRKLIWIFE